MNFTLTFANSGDSIPFTTLSNDTAEVLEYYVNTLNMRDINNFNSNLLASEVQNNIKTLDTTISECNKFVFEFIDKYAEQCKDEEYLNQDYLNKLHSDWVYSIDQDYNIQEKALEQLPAALEIQSQVSKDTVIISASTAIAKISSENFDKFNNINIHLHNLEASFANVKYSTVGKKLKMVNPFSKSLITNHICNFRLGFRHLGRTLYNKFNNFDLNLDYPDENTFDQLLGLVEVGLKMPQTVELSKEYISWCKQHNKIPSGDYLNIGNIPELHRNLTKYRQVMYRNSLQNNSFSIQLTKG